MDNNFGILPEYIQEFAVYVQQTSLVYMDFNADPSVRVIVTGLGDESLDYMCKPYSTMMLYLCVLHLFYFKTYEIRSKRVELLSRILFAEVGYLAKQSSFSLLEFLVFQTQSLLFFISLFETCIL